MKSTHAPAPTPPDPHWRTSADPSGIARASLAATMGGDIASPGAVPREVGPSGRPRPTRTPSHSPVRIVVN